MILQHNLSAMNAQRQFNTVGSRKAKSSEKLSSGYRINRAADDSAGLTISENMRRMVRGLNQGADNTEEGISLCQIADGALAEVNDMLHRMTELSIKSANGTNTDAEREAIQEEINSLKEEIDRISKSTEYNTRPIFDDAKGKDDEKYLVTSPSAEFGYLHEAFNKNGSYYPAATLDFSSIDSSNIADLYGKSFSFDCSQNCGETFEFTFKNIPSDSETSGINPGAGNLHSYTIGIKGMTKGSQLVDEIMRMLNEHPANGTPPTDPNDVYVSHSNNLTKTGSNKLVIYNNWKGFSNPQDAASFYPHPSYKGSVDFSQITNPKVKYALSNVWIQSGAQKDDGESLTFERMNSKILGIDDVDASTQEGAKAALDKINKANAKISGMRTQIGADQNRLEHTLKNVLNIAENTDAAESRIRDTDMASEMVSFSKENILEQAGYSIMAQANQSKQGLISLLD